jgi:hypothetical protein
MSLPVKEAVSVGDPATAAHSKADPILLELWEIKRQLNEEAHYDIAELARRANAFDMDLAMKQRGVSLKPSAKGASLPLDTDTSGASSAA